MAKQKVPCGRAAATHAAMAAIAASAFKSAFTEMFNHAARDNPRGSPRRVISTYLDYMREELRWRQESVDYMLGQRPSSLAIRRTGRLLERP